MPINPIYCLNDLEHARRIMNSWACVKQFSNDHADIVTRMIAQGIAYGRRQAESPVDGMACLNENDDRVAKPQQ